MDDLKLALRTNIDESDSAATAVVAAKAVQGGKRKRTLMWAVAASAALAVAAITFRSFWRSDGVPESQMRVVPLTAYPGNEDLPSFSPDGSQITFHGTGQRGTTPTSTLSWLTLAPTLRLTTARLYVDNREWQARVEELVHSAAAVVVIIRLYRRAVMGDQAHRTTRSVEPAPPHRS